MVGRNVGLGEVGAGLVAVVVVESTATVDGGAVGVMVGSEKNETSDARNCR